MVVRRESHDGAVVEVERPEVSVKCPEVADEPSEISRGWRELEDLLGSQGRKFLGTFDNGGTYRACVQLRDGDDADALGLRTATVPEVGTFTHVSAEIRRSSTNASRLPLPSSKPPRLGTTPIRGSSYIGAWTRLIS